MIVDASVVVKWFVAEERHDEARELLTGTPPLFAPDILAVEFANAMWVKVKGGEIDGEPAQRAVTAVSTEGQPDLRPSTPLARRALQVAQTLDHPVYDCVYLVLAEALDATLVTADERFVAVARRDFAHRVRLLGS